MTNAKRYRRAVPDRPGWWKWKEGGCESPVSLLVVCGSRHSEIAEDDRVEQAIGRPLNEFFCENYWEGTDTAEMPGLWMFEREEPTR